MTWRNWTGDEVAEPAVVASPATKDQLAEVLATARSTERTVRVAGASHSFNRIVATDGVLITLDAFDRVLDADTDSGLVRVEAGMRLYRLNEELAALGLAMPNLGDIDRQSIAGATATGTHGTGARLPNLAAAIESIELMTAAGEVIELNRDGDLDAYLAARVGLGALGVITAVTLQTVPAFTLRGVDAAAPLDEVYANLDGLVDGNDNFEFYVFPRSDIAHTRTNNRHDGPPDPPGRARRWFDDIFMRNHVLGTILRVERRFPSTIGFFNRTIPKLDKENVRVDRSDRILTSPRRFRFTEIEYALPRAATVEAVRAVKRVADRPDLAVSMPIEVRFVAADDALLSPASGRETCTISVHAFEGTAWRDYFSEVEAVMRSLGGRPHWGKRHTCDAALLEPLYPGWKRFAAVRDRLDPGRLFANDYLRRCLDE